MSFVDETIDVVADVKPVYDLWTAFEDYPRFMTVIERVEARSGDRQHWVAVVDEEIAEWDVDIVEHIEETRIRWEAVDGRESGEVSFEKIDSETTRVHYQLEFDPAPWGRDPGMVEGLMEDRVQGDLRAFKNIVEALA
jgi:uncharacterized membrane protein